MSEEPALMADVVCLGEALVDLVPSNTGVGLAAADSFTKAAGGAPANVAVGLSRLGVAAGFIGCLGEDGFGRFLADTLQAAGVALDGLRFTGAAPTALAVVSLKRDGDRDFIFYGNPAAHTMLAPEDIDERIICDARILHFGSITLIGGPAREATLHAIAVARRNNVLVSFDPNLRLALWPDAAAARAAIRLGLSEADIVKIADEEVEFLTSGCDLVEAARSLWHPRLRLMAVTRGARGCTWLTATSEGAEPAVPVSPVDTTGAGDAFMAGLLAGLMVQPELVDDTEALGRVVRFANAAGALATTRRGAIPSLPDRAQVERLLAAHPDAARPTMH